jgi:hypothetical protein
MMAMIPDVKLLAIFRNPVDRAYSQYNMCSEKKDPFGRETPFNGDSFDEVVKDEIEMLALFNITVSQRNLL